MTEAGSTKKNFGLALSGGGFRAALFHLGVIRFMREANLLRQVSHITSVSGGSVIAAHLVLNWERYLGSEEDFDDVTGELIRFLQMDVRNRIVRRFPLASAGNFLRRTVRMKSRRQYTRAGLLEQHYEQHLFGDTGLFSLPETPRLYILATNVNEGSICAFYRDGMLIQRRGRDGKHYFQKISTGLATVPMAVAASSAFPGFFPPLELRAWDVGARAGDFERLAFTDGGIYDNIGLRMFHHIQHSSIPDTHQGPHEVSFERNAFDGIFVSNAGATFKVRTDERAGGLLSTAMRSSDILMDRVNQMELESFRHTDNALFFPITSVVNEKSDPYAPHPQVQRMAALIRTDMDHFTDLEVSTLVQHGYCVAREICRRKAPDLVPSCPTGTPWRPSLLSQDESANIIRGDEQSLDSARKLQKSSGRRIFSTLFSFQDWTTYVWLPIIALLILPLPYFLIRINQTARQRGHVIEAIAETSPVYRKILDLIEDGPVESLGAVEFEESTLMKGSDFSGFEVLSDNRIYDFRGWNHELSPMESSPYVHSTVHLKRVEDGSDNTRLTIQSESSDESLIMSCETQSLRPQYRRMALPSGRYLWEIELDFRHIPVGGDSKAVFEGFMVSESAYRTNDSGGFQFTITADTGVAQIWMLMPKDRSYEKFEISATPLDSPDERLVIVPSSTVELPIGSIATFQLINPKHNYRYECRWNWTEKSD